MQDFKGKVAVITGGASGVGKAIGERLGREGAKLVLADIEQGALDKAVAEFAAKGIEAIGHVTDVTKFESVTALADRAFSHFGKVHLLFNNAGVGPREAQNVWDSGLNEWAWGFNVNVWGVVHGIKAFLPRMVEQNEEAHVVNTSSGNGGLFSLPGSSIYAATKAAVTAITETLYYNLSMQGSPIKVSCLYPGPNIVRTGIYSSDRVRPADLPADPANVNTGINSAEDVQAIMKNFLGKDIDITTPEDVAESTYQGLLKDAYWILPLNERGEEALRTRTKQILARENLTPPDVL
jgi:NAD(P)-dependent dehydrogenase (short-subunit alcohol dehydrogenase family)